MGQRGSGKTDRGQLPIQPRSTGRPASLVPEHPVRDPVQPRESLLASWHIVDSPPSRQEGVGHHVINQVGHGPPTAVGMDRPIKPLVQVHESGITTRHSQPTLARDDSPCLSNVHITGNVRYFVHEPDQTDLPRVGGCRTWVRLRPTRFRSFRAPRCEGADPVVWVTGAWRGGKRPNGAQNPGHVVLGSTGRWKCEGDE